MCNYERNENYEKLELYLIFALNMSKKCLEKAGGVPCIRCFYLKNTYFSQLNQIDIRLTSSPLYDILLLQLRDCTKQNEKGKANEKVSDEH
jgi:hypothetical protein